MTRPARRKPGERPRCYSCSEKPARRGSRFCSNRCAAGWAEAMVDDNQRWCADLRAWYPAEANGQTHLGDCTGCGGDIAVEIDRHPKNG